MNFLEKIDYLMDKNKLNKSTLSQASGIPYTTIDGWYKKGYAGAKLPTIQKLATFFNTTLDYLMREEITDVNYGKTDGFKIEYSEMNHIKKYRDLDDHGKEMIDIILLKETERIQQSTKALKSIALVKPNNIDTNMLRLSKYFQGSISAGNGVYMFGDEGFDEIEIPVNALTDKADFVISVNGRSMEPLYNDKDKVLVSQHETVEIGDVGIFIRNCEAFIKELGTYELISINKEYPNIKISDSDNVVCMGKVIGKLTN